jgi:hypothetical protein
MRKGRLLHDHRKMINAVGEESDQERGLTFPHNLALG